MILRTMALAAGLTGAATLSQFPEFSQQYTQRLGGAVDELSAIVMMLEHEFAWKVRVSSSRVRVEGARILE